MKIWVIWIVFLLYSCEKESMDVVPPQLMVVPHGFPMPGFPADNHFTPERWALGKRLFFDTILSSDLSISCASCHRPDLAFTDGKQLSTGIENRIGTRNAPSLANVAYHPYLTREGGVPTLEMQILVPIQEHAEFDFNIVEVVERLKKDSTYVHASRIAYGRDPDPFVITRAISCFERSLISGNSRYDQFQTGHQNAMNEEELFGQHLFFSERLSCNACHGGFNFTDYRFENNGLYEEYADPGRYRFTELEKDRALFKIPSLRNIAVTYPYMHDGSFPDLTSVIEHYNAGGKDHPHKSSLIRPLNLSQAEKNALIAFLNSLTDEEFLYNPNYLP